MIVIPMAGLSRRFSEAGYDRPKYMLDAHGRSLFAHSVMSFENYFTSHDFLFICRDVQDTVAFVRGECAALGIQNAEVITLDHPTRGQAETVAAGVAASHARDDDPLTIFNSDTIRPGFRFPPAAHVKAGGFLEVFRGSGENWSFVLPAGDSDQVAETAEKRPISNLCCTGLYHFARASDFTRSYDAEVARPPQEWDARELYVAPLYNHLIREGQMVRYSLIDRDAVIFCGIPEEYEAFKSYPYLS